MLSRGCNRAPAVVRRLAAVAAVALSLAVPASALDAPWEIFIPDDVITGAISDIAAIRDDAAALREDVAALREIAEMGGWPASSSSGSGDEAVLEVEPEAPANQAEASRAEVDDIADAIFDTMIDAGVLVPDGTDGDSILYSVRGFAGGADDDLEELPEVEVYEEVTEPVLSPTGGGDEEPSTEATEELSTEATEEPSTEATEETSAEATEEPEPTPREMLSQLHTDIIILIISVWGVGLMLVGLSVGKTFFPV